MTKDDMIALADEATAEGDRLNNQGQFLRAAEAHKRASDLWRKAGSIVMPNACLVDAQNCERAHEIAALFDQAEKTGQPVALGSGWYIH